MLIRYAVENFRSIRDRVEFSFVAGSYREHPKHVAQIRALRHGLLRTAAIYGPNASGKSNVLRALHYMRSAVINSFRRWKPNSGINTPTFALDRSRNKPAN